ncbi:TPA: hypothetical protein EYP66_02135 [Candidatus Poribacteria bacterium]|nr:hypothetical protein [Candidatus Poribacteria bacterium]
MKKRISPLVTSVFIPLVIYWSIILIGAIVFSQSQTKDEAGNQKTSVSPAFTMEERVRALEVKLETSLEHIAKSLDQIHSLIKWIFTALGGLFLTILGFWYQIHKDVRENLRYISDVRDEVANVRAEITNEISDVRTELRTEIANVRIEIMDVRSELNDTKSSFAAALAEMSSRFTTELAEMKSTFEREIGETRVGFIEELSKVRNELTTINATLEGVQQRLGQVEKQTQTRIITET